MGENNIDKTFSMNVEDREIVINRHFNAPRTLVWEAWTQPQHLANWWGPKGFTNTIHEIEVSVGGVWRFDLHGPDGVNYPNKIVFIEVVKPERLVYAASDGNDDSPGQFETTVTFSDLGDQTALTMKLLFKTSEERNYVVQKFGAIEGGNQTLDRLSEQLAKM
ncbi:SRPBCC family protein [Paenibacillus sp. GSMTC-2017]|uniref:SRPBCC family protein n=1 Tax=Paenibacillus sp. GSMTC-2017 TaxID=2794350 RepID=UPI0018D5F4F1|nr:SRPBCC family protein [Paenibacillus sp. GSMTC-2017]MBH5317665.1 SRPBCC family protein [Paenibacillus sp. GSMTC-2017]